MFWVAAAVVAPWRWSPSGTLLARRDEFVARLLGSETADPFLSLSSPPEAGLLPDESRNSRRAVATPKVPGSAVPQTVGEPQRLHR